MLEHPSNYIGIPTALRSQHRPFGIKRNDRFRHIYILGKTGTGKSTLEENLIIQDLRNNEGVCVIDPHGTLVTRLLDFVPSHRANETVYFDPRSESHAIGLNIFAHVPERIRPLVVSQVVSVFRNIFPEAFANAPRLEHLLRNGTAALLDVPGTTMLSLPRLYTSHEYGERIFSQTLNPAARDFWYKEYKPLSKKTKQEWHAPLFNKVGAFLVNPLIRTIVAQTQPKPDIQQIMDSRSVLLVNLAKGLIGEDCAKLIGSVIITKLYMAALARAEQSFSAFPAFPEFHLYLDESQFVATPVMADILSEARKFLLSLTLCNQFLAQLDRHNVLEAIKGNVGTFIVFGIGADDAKRLAPEFYPTITERDLINQPAYNCYIKLCIDGQTSRPFSAVTLPPDRPRPTEGNRESILKTSEERWGMRRDILEEKIRRWYEHGTPRPRGEEFAVRFDP
jgi:hypothetical protein